MLSVVAGIVDPAGKLLRVVIEHPSMLAGHVGKGETAHILPDVHVIEPVPLDHAADLIARVRAMVEAR